MTADELNELDEVSHAISQLAHLDSADTEDVGVEPVVDELDAPRPVAAVHEPIEVAEDVQLPLLENLQLTDAVWKWFLKADAKYRRFFIRRLEQLASGQRCRILSKRLTGCKHHIYETYFDQAGLSYESLPISMD